jgi:hypothetical protein
MFDYKRSKRQVEFSSYPRENLKIDKNIIESEALSETISNGPKTKTKNSQTSGDS